jgi:hypothetical protein
MQEEEQKENGGNEKEIEGKEGRGEREAQKENGHIHTQTHTYI